MSLKDLLLENSLAYKIWQKPFVEQKLSPLLRGGEIKRARRVLDVGCGPGTNTAHFANATYLGIDINPKYVEYARHRYGREFIAADVTEYSVDKANEFDFILLNSFLHHIDTARAGKLLRHLSTFVSEDGYIHVLDMVLPPKRFSIPRILARLDRGDYPRSFEALRDLIQESFEVVNIERYPLSACGITLWDFVYFKARARHSR